MPTTQNPKLDKYFAKAGKWQKELQALRAIALGSKLSEEMKWGQPCYTLGKSNIVLIHAFKEYCAFLFFKGALMKDPKKILIQQTENVQAARQIRFTSAAEITKLKSALKAYIQEAIAVEKSGAKVSFRKTAEFNIPAEFRKKLDADHKLENAFYELTPGRQRGYLLFFSSAKQEKTREARIEKCIPQILKGKGLDD